MFSETHIELEDDYSIAPPNQPNTWVDWLMLAASAIFFLIAVYFKFGA